MQVIIANRPIFPRNSFLVINGVKIDDKDNGGLYFEVDAKTGEEGKVGVASIKIYNLSQIIEVGSEIELWFGYDSDVDFCVDLIKNVGVAAVPGSSFFKEEENRYIRFHFAKKDETLLAALNRLKDMRAKMPYKKTVG